MSKTNHLNTQRVDAYIVKRKKNSRFQKYLDVCGRGLALYTGSVFSRKLSLLHRLLGLLIETGKKTNKQKQNKQKNNNNNKKTISETILYSGHLSAPVSFSVLRFALASAVNTRIHSGQTVMQVNGQQVLYR